jgi:hypothetical protein
MRDLTAESTLAAKKEFERCAIRGIKVQHYHADNGRFAEPAFVAHREFIFDTDVSAKVLPVELKWSSAKSHRDLPNVSPVPVSFVSIGSGPALRRPSRSLAPFTVIPTRFGSAVLLSQFPDGWNARYVDSSSKDNLLAERKPKRAKVIDAGASVANENARKAGIFFFSHEHIDSIIHSVTRGRGPTL